MKKKVFIDGREGTTGLRIYDRLEKRDDIEIIKLSEEKRKDAGARREAINSSDVTFLCLPDAAAIEAVAMVENPDTVVIDTSTAHRTDPSFAYGFPELGEEFFEKIRTSKRISVPGCHASGFIALVYPLVKSGYISPSARLCCHSITGYSGGGKKMIAQYEDSSRSHELDSPRQYGLSQQHKHLKEMKKITDLENAPVFCPIVSDYYSGMEVTVPLFREDVSHGYGMENIKKLYRDFYSGKFVSYDDTMGEDGFIAANGLSGFDGMRICVTGNEERMLLISRFDNLGKGASGAAVECLNIALGCDMTYGLDL